MTIADQKMTIWELKNWHKCYRQYKTEVMGGLRMDTSDKEDLIKLNHRLMELCHRVHNNEMLKK